MVSGNAVGGMLLEEAVLHLLRRSGYKTIEAVGTDPTLEMGPAGICVKGRGTKHQIDAIADFLVSQPFSNPQRLLVESKYYPKNPVQLETIRNSVGVLKDVNEFWSPTNQPGLYKKRFHYSSAIVAATTFTKNAQEYAFAQDIFLIPLRNSLHFVPILQAITRVVRLFKPNIRPNIRNQTLDQPGLTLSNLRRDVRHALRGANHRDTFPYVSARIAGQLLEFISACQEIDYCLIAVLEGGFPLFLVPAKGISLGGLRSPTRVRIRWVNGAWYLTDRADRKLFSFDLPPSLFDLYEESGMLTRRGVANMKEQYMASFQTIVLESEQPKVINFLLDREWLAEIRAHL